MKDVEWFKKCQLKAYYLLGVEIATQVGSGYSQIKLNDKEQALLKYINFSDVIIHKDMPLKEETIKEIECQAIILGLDT